MSAGTTQQTRQRESSVDCLAGIVGVALLATGRPVDITAVEPADLERVRSFYDGLSDTSTYYRFFGIRPALPEHELRSIVDPDVPHHVVLLASVDDELIGIGEYIVTSNPKQAEVAFAVADDHHREGVATLLLERLAAVARRCGLTQLVAQTLPGNEDMLLVFRTVGLAERTEFRDGVIEVTLDLASVEHLEAEASRRHQQALEQRRASDV